MTPTERADRYLDNIGEGVHTCSDACQKPACIIAGLRRELAEARELLLDTVHPTQYAVIPPGWLSRRAAFLTPSPSPKLEDPT